METTIESMKTDKAEINQALSVLITEYAGTLPDRIADLSRVIDQLKLQPEDCLLRAEAISQAHKLRGTAPCYGFATVGQCMTRVEETLHSHVRGVCSEPAIWGEMVLRLEEALASVRKGTKAEGSGADNFEENQTIYPHQPGPEQEEMQPPVSNRDVIPLKVLLVEDDGDYYKFVNHLLNFSQNGHFVLCWTSSLSDALRCLSEGTPDVILLDLLLPDSEGLDTFSRIKEHAGGIPIVILTASDDQQLGINAVAGGAQDYLNKQRISSDSLLRCIRYAIERKHHEESQLRLQAVEDFMGTLAHDLQVPMIGAELLLDGLLAGRVGSLPPEQANVISLLKNGNNRLLSLVKRLLQVYRLDVAKIQPDVEMIDVSLLVRACLSEFVAIIESKKLEVITHLPFNLPQIAGDKPMLRLLFVNLLENAVKFSPPGTTITIRAENISEAIAFQVRNFGDIIPPEDQVRIFERFWQGVPGKKYVAQTGTGLYLCNRIVSLHLGRIKCQSTPDEGTTLTVVLPVASTLTASISEAAK